MNLPFLTVTDRVSLSSGHHYWLLAREGVFQLVYHSVGPKTCGEPVIGEVEKNV
jgi:hypothetical protein